VKEFERGLASFPTKYQLIFKTMLETGFRISDVLNLKTRDIKNGKNIYEKKTRKKRLLSISEDLKNSLLGYAKEKHLRNEDFIFPSTKNNLCRPVHRTSVYRVFRTVSNALQLDGCVRPHSCRKTYAKNYIASGGDLKGLQKDLNHSNKKTTEGYLT
jgi:integrase